jgi:hypothetical protein
MSAAHIAKHSDNMLKHDKSLLYNLIQLHFIITELFRYLMSLINSATNKLKEPNILLHRLVLVSNQDVLSSILTWNMTVLVFYVFPQSPQTAVKRIPSKYMTTSRSFQIYESS